jgi:uncharacterized membrane protein
MEKWRSPRGRFALALIVSSLVSVGLFAYGAWRTRSLASDYLVWNLFLAWLPLLFSLRLMAVLKRKLWSSWEAILWSFLWLAFLPNSFYMISDFIHLLEAPPARILYDAVMFTSFVATGVVLGFSSLYLVHLQLRRRFSYTEAGIWSGVVLLLCSAAIYLGRDLRWNTWDILVNPGGLLFEISDRVEHPAAYPHMLLIIAAFFVVLASVYNVLWHGSRLFLPRRVPAAHPSHPTHQTHPDGPGRTDY